VEGIECDHGLLGGPAEAVARALVREGMLAERDGRLACTERGFLLLDGMLERIADAATASFDKVPGRP
jgi:hypothetical protein